MRFNFVHTSLMEIDDDILIEYIMYCDENKIDYSVDGLIDYLTLKYCLDDFVQGESACHDLRLEYLLDEINYIKEKYKDD